MRRNAIWLGVFTISILSTMLFVQPTSAQTVSGFTVALGCSSYDWTAANFTADRDNTGTKHEAGYVQVTDGAGKVLIQLNTWAEIGSGSFGAGSAVYSSLPDYNPLTYQWISKAGDGFDEQMIHSATGTCDGLPTYSMTSSDTAHPMPGPDMVPIPDTAVGGTFTDWTPLYFAPNADSASPYTMAPGQSLYVFGIDATKQFYQVLLSGSTYWVPASNLGPTYDDVWQGTPLPTNVIE